MERNIVLYPTIHPSYLLRLPDEAARKRQHALFVEDMQLIKHLGETLAAQQ